ncbi:MAG: hypothetical protein AB1468_05585, partial [Candidatus Micrarchaeota archaeon]
MEIEEVRIGAGDPRARLFKDFVEEARKYEMAAAAQKKEGGEEEGEVEEVREPGEDARAQTYRDMRTLIAKVEKAAVATRMITEAQPTREEIAERERMRAEGLAVKVATSARLEEGRMRKESKAREEEKKLQAARTEKAREEVIQRILAARESAKHGKKEEMPSLE